MATMDKIAALPTDVSFARRLQSRAQQHPDRTAVVDGDRSYTWAEMHARVQALAAVLSAEGIGRGDRVALLGRNSAAYAEAFLATVAAGACAVPLPTMASPEALALMLADSAPRAVFVAEAYRDALQPGVASLGTAPRLRVGLDFTDALHADYSQRLERGRGGQFVDDARPQDEFNVIYSSGTTGTPKGIVHSHALRVRGALAQQGFKFEGGVNLCSTPLYSNTTIVTWLPALWAGATTVMMSKFDAGRFLELAERHRVTHAMLVPVQYDRLLHHPDFDRRDLSAFRFQFCTSAPLREGLKRQVVDRFPGELAEFYGLTEGGISTTLLANRFPDKLASVGRPVGCEVRIIDADGNVLPPGQTGEICGRNAFMMKGYLNREDATREAMWLDADGNAFLRTGDIGRLDADGFLYLSDRKKDVIISGGLNIYATDLEVVLAQHDAVREVAVIGVPSTEWGETPLALVVPRPGAETPDLEALRQWANARLGKSQRISRIELREGLPKSDIGKVLKRELRTPYWKD